jgi:hypothetical protein
VIMVVSIIPLVILNLYVIWDNQRTALSIIMYLTGFQTANLTKKKAAPHLRSLPLAQSDSQVVRYLTLFWL